MQEIKGIFNGQIMVTENGALYPVTENYASKSKLVEGDELTLRIQDDGSFIYKQSKQVSRISKIAEIVELAGNLVAEAEGKPYHLLNSSKSYYKLNAGDRVVIIVPFETESTWAALDNKL